MNSQISLIRYWCKYYNLIFRTLTDKVKKEESFLISIMSIYLFIIKKYRILKLTTITIVIKSIRTIRRSKSESPRINIII